MFTADIQERTQAPGALLTDAARGLHEALGLLEGVLEERRQAAGQAGAYQAYYAQMEQENRALQAGLADAQAQADAAAGQASAVSKRLDALIARVEAMLLISQTNR